MFLPAQLDPKSVDEVMGVECEETIANDLWERLRPLLLAGDNRMHAAGIVISMMAKYGQDDYHHSQLLMADYTGELGEESTRTFELCQYETCRQPATWRGFLELEGVIPVCNQCVVEIEDPVLI